MILVEQDDSPFERWPRRVRKVEARRWIEFWAGQVERFKSPLKTQMLYSIDMDDEHWEVDITEPSWGRDGVEMWLVRKRQAGRRRSDERRYVASRGVLNLTRG